VLALVYVADLPQDEVARLLHVSRSTVASTVADAKSAVLAHDSLPIAWGSLEGLQ
jgi:DNA-directed RNA polymerase specialized sigma24 family protein